MTSENVNNNMVEQIAIIGMDGRFPEAENVTQLWENLRAGKEAISFFSKEELKTAGIENTLLDNHQYVRAQGCIKGPDMFDAGFFGFSPAEAEILDPQHRVFLESSWSALENAGYDPDTYDGAIGVYASTSQNHYLLRNQLDYLESGRLFGVDKDFLATRVSYKLNLRGPSLTIQTACSSSLVAVCEASQSLLDYRCDIALAGGVSIPIPLIGGYLYQEGGILSPDGHCRPFDANAKGTLAGAGVGIVVLKRLSEALEDGDSILGVIKGFAVNNDGSDKVGYTAPSIRGQVEVINIALELADVKADTISYVEAHGTGTILGDPIEITALTKAYKAHTDKIGFCSIGSVKSNIGHLDAAAGVAGLIKVVLSLQNKQIPASLNFERPNPKINIEKTPFYVNNTLSDWQPHEGMPCRAGVSAFGIGGTNAHVILEEAPLFDDSGMKKKPSKNSDQVLLLSAKTKTALEMMSQNLAAHLRQRPDISFGNVAYTLQVGRKMFQHRRMLVCSDVNEAISILDAIAPQTVNCVSSDSSEINVVFMFSGQGAQYPNMTLDLYRDHEIFRNEINNCCEILRLQYDLNLLPLLYPENTALKEAEERLMQTSITQPALFVVEYALTQLWMSWGVKPSAMIGHSLGEYVAACLAGVFPLEDALNLVVSRSRLMQAQPNGAMLNVTLSHDELRPFMNEFLEISVINGPRLCVVSGPSEMVDALEERLLDLGHSVRQLHTSHAFHSAMMEPILSEFIAECSRISMAAPKIPYISNVSGTWMTKEQAIDPCYWGQHIRQTVQFSAGIEILLEDKQGCFLEIGPGNTLSTFVRQYISNGNDTTDEFSGRQRILSSVRHPKQQQSDTAFILNTLGQLWLSGKRLDWRTLHGKENRCRIPLPTYPFERQHYWMKPNEKQGMVGSAVGATPLIKNTDVTSWFYTPTWQRHPAPSAITLAIAEEKHDKMCWLVFVDNCGLGDSLVVQMRDLGYIVAIVTPGLEYRCEPGNYFTIAPDEPSHYVAVLNVLQKQQRLPDGVLHLWGVGKPEDLKTSKASEKLLYACFYSPIHIAQALGSTGSTEAVQFVIISDGMQVVIGDEQISPYKATLLGPNMVISLEYEHISCRSIDVLSKEFSNNNMGVLIKLLIAELSSKSPHNEVAYRGGYCWTRGFQSLDINLGEKKKAKPENRRLRENGVYLLTGGLGGMGLSFAKYLAKTVSAKLVLLGRSTFPIKGNWDTWLSTHPETDATSRKIQKIREIETLGGEVMVVSADVTSYEQMQGIVGAARKQFGAIHGVVHAAGIPSGGLIQLKTRQSMTEVLAPKIIGAQILDRIFQDSSLDFMFLCSSLTAISGAIGQVDYTAANAFLDAFAHHRSQKGTYTVSVNWDVWSNVGMATEADVPDSLLEFRRNKLADGIQSDKGAEAFSRALQCDVPQLVVATTNAILYRDRFQEHNQLLPDIHLSEETSSPSKNDPTHRRPRTLIQNYVAPSNELEQGIGETLQNLLGIQQIGVEDNFFDLGGHSLLAIQAITRLKTNININISLDKFLELGNIKNMATYVEALRCVADSTKEISSFETSGDREEFEL